MGLPASVAVNRTEPSLPTVSPEIVGGVLSTTNGRLTRVPVSASSGGLSGESPASTRNS